MTPIQIKRISKLLMILFSCSQLFSACTAPAEEKAKTEKFELTDTLLSTLRIDTVSDPDAGTALSFSAKITPNEETTARIFPMVSGNVTAVPVRLGDKVSSGQVLAVLGSPEMAGYDQEAISAQAALQTATRLLKQAEDLYKSGLGSARELEEAKNEFLSKQAESRRSQAVLRLNGGGTNGKYSIKSPVSGFIIEKNVNNNMQLRQDHNNSLFTVADLSQVWGIINIYESDIASIKEGDDVKLSVLSYPDQVFNGRINKIYNVLDEDSKVMHARVIIPNPGFLLKPGMMASVQVTVKNASRLPAIQADHIIFDQDKNYVLILDQQRKIRIQEIQIKHKSGSTAYISQGLQAGDRVVASKQVFLYESLKN